MAVAAVAVAAAAVAERTWTAALAGCCKRHSAGTPDPRAEVEPCRGGSESVAMADGAHYGHCHFHPQSR